MDWEDATSGSPVSGRCSPEFREDGGCVPIQSHTSESFLEYFPSLGRAEPLVDSTVDLVEA